MFISHCIKSMTSYLRIKKTLSYKITDEGLSKVFKVR